MSSVERERGETMLHASFRENGNWSAGYVDYSRNGSNKFSRIGTMVYVDEDENDEMAVSFNITVVLGIDGSLNVVTFVCDTEAAFPTWELPIPAMLDHMIKMGLYKDFRIMNIKDTDFSSDELDKGIAEFLLDVLERNENE